jgi:hypothetical protein
MAFKASIGCLNPNCSWNGPYTGSMLDAHHVGGKSFSIAKAVNGKGVPLDELNAELAKCTLVCANCHRMIHEKSLDVLTFARFPVIEVERRC